MSLRWRAVLIAGIALIVPWALAAAWMMHGVQANLDRALDDRLAMSARMVSGLMARAALLPQRSPHAAPQPDWAEVIRVSSQDGIACEIRSEQGAVIAQTDGSPDAAANALPMGYSTREIDGKSWRIYLLDRHGYQIITADRIDKREVLTAEMLRAASIPFLIAVVGGLVALWFGIDRGLSPLKTLRQTLRDKRTDDTNPIDGGHAPAELQPVIGALNGLLTRLAQALAHQRAFTDAAAHELRTPLTAIDTHLQVARLVEGEEGQASLQHAEEGVRRLRHTLDQMMTLARTEGAMQNVDPCASVTAVVGDMLARMDAPSRARIVLTTDGLDAGTPIPKHMLDTSIRNLVDNALRYSPADQPIALNVAFDSRDKRCRIEVADRGPGLSDKQAEQIGQRFWRGDQGRRQGEGAGLGISIVRAIMGRFGGALELKPREGGGLLAVLQMPLI